VLCPSARVLRSLRSREVTPSTYRSQELSQILLNRLRRRRRPLRLRKFASHGPNLPKPRECSVDVVLDLTMPVRIAAESRANRKLNVHGRLCPPFTSAAQAASFLLTMHPRSLIRRVLALRRHLPAGTRRRSSSKKFGISINTSKYDAKERNLMDWQASVRSVRDRRRMTGNPSVIR